MRVHPDAHYATCASSDHMHARSHAREHTRTQRGCWAVGAHDDDRECLPGFTALEGGLTGFASVPARAAVTRATVSCGRTSRWHRLKSPIRARLKAQAKLRHASDAWATGAVVSSGLAWLASAQMRARGKAHACAASSTDSSKSSSPAFAAGLGVFGVFGIVALPARPATAPARHRTA